jgi:Redoxin.
MKQLLFFIFLIFTMTISSFNNLTELPIGSPMPNPDVKMTDISGKEISLKEAVKKNGLLVMFSCNTCPYVIKNQGRTLAINKYALANDVGVILLNPNEGNRNGEDSFEAMKDYASAQGYSFYYAVDKKALQANAFGAKRTPECFLFSKDNKLVYHGAIDDNPGNASAVTRQHLKEAIDEMLAGKEIMVKNTRSVGCSIKRN